MKIPKKILRFEKLPSTNEYARKIAREGEEEGTLILAETQTRGKGRIGRRWFSPPGGIYFSLILRPPVSLSICPFLSIVGGVAVAKGIKGVCGIEVKLKWPNDILINEEKVGGILIETEGIKERVNFVVLGIGINVNIRKDDLPKRTIWPATSIMGEINRRINCEDLIKRILIELEKNYSDFVEGKILSILKEWQGMDIFFGREIIVREGERKIEGEGMGIDKDGAYKVRLKDKTIRRVVAGDITLRS
jgi:BirA family biotin operon repressor/biotin-[acetyl-CoA-carboxylase] ligase